MHVCSIYFEKFRIRNHIRDRNMSLLNLLGNFLTELLKEGCGIVE